MIPICVQDLDVVGFVRLDGLYCVEETAKPGNDAWILLARDAPLRVGVIFDGTSHHWVYMAGGRFKIVGRSYSRSALTALGAGRFGHLFPDMTPPDLDILREKCSKYCEQF